MANGFLGQFELDRFDRFDKDGAFPMKCQQILLYESPPAETRLTVYRRLSVGQSFEKIGRKSVKIENFEKIDFFRFFDNFLSKLLEKPIKFK